MNEQLWTLADYCGLKFENHIFDIICHVLDPLLKQGINIYQTPSTRDDGKDIVIESAVPFQLFGVNFILKGKEKIRLYIECKSSDKEKIDLDKFSKNLLIANHDDIDYLVLVTNTTISPFSYYQATENAHDYNYEFVLIDQFLLYNFLSSNNAVIGKYDELIEKDNFSVSYQICKGSPYGKPRFDLYLFFRNNEEKNSLCTFRLKSDRNWKLSHSNFKVFLDPCKSTCKKIIVEKEYFDGIDNIIIDFSIDQVHKLIEIDGTSINYRFEMPLVGEKHKQIINNIDQEIHENTTLNLFYIHGNAGVGKTRIINELCKRQLNRGTQLIYYRCKTQKKQTTTYDFIKTLKKSKEFVCSNSIIDSLKGRISKYRKIIIVIEDIHNASEEFFDEIGQLKSADNFGDSITILLAGRDDYTVYNEAYFTFMDMILHDPPKYFRDVKIEYLSDKDSYNLIRTIINEVPSSIIEKIQQASQNIPFYIVQFIEYMLDTNLLYLVNRNTVGITNISTFNQKIYIPPKVEAILNKRFKNLGYCVNGKKLQHFLLILAYCEFEFPQKYLVEFFDDEDIHTLDILFKIRFLRLTNSGNIFFEHENIFLYLKKQATTDKNSKEISKTIYAHPSIFTLLDTLKKGRIYLQLKDYKNARLCFDKPISDIERMTNFSSENLDAAYFEYMEDIYYTEKFFRNRETQKKTILAYIYLAMHNQENGKGSKTFENCMKLIKKYHKNDIELEISFEQLQTHFYMQKGMLSKAQKGMNELIAKERANPELFSDEIRFNLFDRFASLNLQFNHMQPAVLYNKLSRDLALKLNDPKLLTLSYITEAKISFYENTNLSYSLMEIAQNLLAENKVMRIQCHNNLSMLTAELLMKKNTYTNLIERASQLLQLSLDIHYPSAEIRAHFLLAVIFYLKGDSIDFSKKHIETAITMSIRYGNAKIMAPIYNLKAMIAIAENQSSETVYKYYSTMMQYLKQQNLLFLGGLDFGYGNIINLTNYAKFLVEYGLESELYHMMSEISYYGSNVLCDFNCDKNNQCYYSCQKNIEIFKENCRRLKDGGLLFLDKKYKYDLIDGITNCLVPIGV